MRNLIDLIPKLADEVNIRVESKVDPDEQAREIVKHGTAPPNEEK